MARTFRRTRTAQPIAELNVTNLIDLGFTLLIIFMIATPLITQEQTVPVNLPIVSKVPQVKPDPDMKFEVVTIKADGTYNLGDRALSLAQLSAEFKNFAADPKPPTIRFRMDAKSTADQILKVITELEKYNLPHITFDTKTADQ